MVIGVTGTIRDIPVIVGGVIVIGTILATIAIGLTHLPKLIRKTLSKVAGIVIGIVMGWSIITFLEKLSFWCYDHNVVWLSCLTIALFIGGCIYLSRRIHNS